MIVIDVSEDVGGIGEDAALTYLKRIAITGFFFFFETFSCCNR